MLVPPDADAIIFALCRRVVQFKGDLRNGKCVNREGPGGNGCQVRSGRHRGASRCRFKTIGLSLHEEAVSVKGGAHVHGHLTELLAAYGIGYLGADKDLAVVHDALHIDARLPVLLQLERNLAGGGKKQHRQNIEYFFHQNLYVTVKVGMMGMRP